MVRPKRVELREREVAVQWSDGHSSLFSNKALRSACPCASCQGERGLLGKMYRGPERAEAPPDVRAVSSSLVGLYAISFAWSDGHTSGIYPYEFLLERCECGDCKAKRQRSRERQG